MHGADGVDELDTAEHGVDLVRLQVADHVEAHGARLLDELETLKLAMQLLRTVLTKYTISGIDGGEYLHKAHGLGNGDELHLVTSAAAHSEGRVNALQNLRAPILDEGAVILFHRTSFRIHVPWPQRCWRATIRHSNAGMRRP